MNEGETVSNGDVGKRKCWLIANEITGEVVGVWFANEFNLGAIPAGCELSVSTVGDVMQAINSGRIAS